MYPHWFSLHFTFVSAAVGMMYLQGQGCMRDDEKGLWWLKKSSEGGCVYATGLLAHHYYTTKLFSKAAETAFKQVTCPFH